MWSSFLRRYAALIPVTIALAATAAAAQPMGSSDWPQFRGPDRTGVSREAGLLKQWPANGPALVWNAVGIGEGVGGIAVTGGRIYTTGDSEGLAWLYALNEADGKQVWKAQIGRGGKLGNVFRPSGPRSTPTVDGKRIYVLSQHGELVCFTTEGKEVWRTDYVKDHQGIVPVWGCSESPLIDGEKLICTPGAEDGALMALDKHTGKLLWKTHVPEGPTGNRGFLGKSGAAYASLIAIDFEGQRQYVQLASTTLVGVAASDGKLLWRYDRASNTHRINCFTPVYHDGVVFTATAYDAGAGAVKLTKEPSGAITATELFFNTRLKQQHGGMVLVDGYLYGTLESGFLNCIELKTGQVMWQERGPGKGSITYADGRLYCRSEAKGTVSLVEANPKQYVEHGHFDQPDRTAEAAWAHPVVVNGRLYLRDQDHLLCFSVKAPTP